MAKSPNGEIEHINPSLGFPTTCDSFTSTTTTASIKQPIISDGRTRAFMKIVDEHEKDSEDIGATGGCEMDGNGDITSNEENREEENYEDEENEIAPELLSEEELELEIKKMRKMSKGLVGLKLGEFKDALKFKRMLRCTVASAVSTSAKHTTERLEAIMTAQEVSVMDTKRQIENLSDKLRDIEEERRREMRRVQGAELETSERIEKALKAAELAKSVLDMAINTSSQELNSVENSSTSNKPAEPKGERTFTYRSNTQLSSFPKPTIFKEPTHYHSARNFVREFEEWAQMMFPGDEKTRAKVFVSFLSGMPKHWYNTAVRDSAMAANTKEIYKAFEEKFGPSSMSLTTGGFRNRRHREGKQTTTAYINDMNVLLAQTNVPEKLTIDSIFMCMEDTIRELLVIDDLEYKEYLKQ